MDISLTISLMRGQMGTVIERAVSAAVETVLGEMLRVVGIKFDELKMEMAAKEKETENIRQMLEISRSQMKTMRKHMNALGENAHAATYQTYHRTGFGHSDPCRVHGSSGAALSSGLPEPPRRTVPNNNQMPTTNGNLQPRNRVTITLPSENMVRASQPSDTLVRATQPSDNLVRATQPSDTLVRATQPSDNRVTVRATSTSFDSHDDLTTMISQAVEDPSLTPTVSAMNSSSEHLEPLKGAPNPLDPEVSDESQRREEEEECEAEWTISTQPPETSTDPGTQLVLSPPRTDGADCSAVTARSVLPPSLSQFQVKEEEAEVDIICIKQEPEEVETLLINLAAEGFNSHGNLLDRQTQGNVLLDSHRTIAASESQRDRRAPRPPQGQRTLAEHTPFTSADSCSYGLSQAVMSMSGGVAPRPMVRPWPKDLSLYEEFKMRRTELRRRSQNRQREMEKNLPQPLLADLVKERREKTRLRVARWRAKRKLQACLLTQMTQHQQAGPGLGQGNSLNSGLGNPSQNSHHTQHKTTGPTQTQQRNSAGVSQSQYNNRFLYNRTHCDSGPGNINYTPLQFNNSSLMLGQHGGHGMVEHVMEQPAMTSSSQQGLSLRDSELYQ